MFRIKNGTVPFVFLLVAMKEVWNAVAVCIANNCQHSKLWMYVYMNVFGDLYIIYMSLLTCSVSHTIAESQPMIKCLPQ